MIIRAEGVVNVGGARMVSARCPACRQLGTFEPMGQDLMLTSSGPSSTVVGHRRCPNPQCRAHIFVVLDRETIVASHPPLRIDFDTVNVPAAVVAALSEAITCHANECYVASALMVRKTLEELCQDRQARGNNLKDRIRDLGTKIVLPQELLDGLDDLRLLGNDAAHIESREYDKVGKEEVEVAIEFAKEVLKATYQYSALLNRLRALKKTP
jgi:HEPN domain-containing protein